MKKKKILSILIIGLLILGIAAFVAQKLQSRPAADHGSCCYNFDATCVIGSHVENYHEYRNGPCPKEN